ncbi:MAG: carbohydrate ABC transporter substrate-binding protein [Nitriliruptoraceae bacterium]|nr:carbohydrate ABC transporter substrate-binding protein [Nitriliruptoraceae bacterium]
MKTTKNRWWRMLAATSALAMVAVACGDGDDGDAAGDGELETVDEGEELEAGEEGTITVLHALTGDTDTAGLRAAFAAFSEETGITVQEQGSSDFEQLARSRVEGGNPPDIVLHPQPGLMRDLVDQELATAATDWVDLDQLNADMVDGLVELGEWNDEFYGLMVRLSLKSLVWYIPSYFEENGYDVPETWDEMVELTDTIRESGDTPWCIGIESSDATGWVATDWIEDIMLRLHGGDAYDDWVANDLPFNSPEVTEAVEDYMAPIWFTEGNVFGGPPNILQTSFGDSAGVDLFDGNCHLHRQASFIEGFFPDGTTVGEDVDFFYLPEITEAGQGAPVLIAGDLAVAYTDNPSNAEFFQYFSTPESGEPWGAEGAWLSPFSDFDTSAYADQSLAAQGEIITDADFARFDASDMMPGAVGAGSFWTEMVNYVQSNGEDLEARLQAIDDSWPN